MLVNEYCSNAGVSFGISPEGRGSDGIFQDFENFSAKRFSPQAPLAPLPSSPVGFSAKRFSLQSRLVSSPPPPLPLSSSTRHATIYMVPQTSGLTQPSIISQHVHPIVHQLNLYRNCYMLHHHVEIYP